MCQCEWLLCQSFWKGKLNIFSKVTRSYISTNITLDHLIHLEIFGLRKYRMWSDKWENIQNIF